MNQRRMGPKSSVSCKITSPYIRGSYVDLVHFFFSEQVDTEIAKRLDSTSH